MPDRIKVFALGGLDENGRDCYIVEINDDIFVLDAGLSIPDKTMPGVDCLLPNFEYLEKNKNKVRAYLMTHGHDENIGSLRFMYKVAPATVYCTYTTQAVINNQMAIHHDVVQMNYQIVNPSDDLVIAGRKIRLFQTCHNAANSFGVAISTDQGNIIFTSDFIINFATEENNYQFDLMKSSELAREETLLLMCESKASANSGFCSPKHRVAPLVEKYFKMDKRIFVSCYWQNMYRIREIIRLIKKYNKKLYFYDAYTEKVIRDVIIEGTKTNILDSDILKKEDFLRTKRGEVVVLLVGHSDDIFEEITALSNHTNSDSRISVDKDDIFINVAIPRPSFETIATRSIDNLYRTGCEVAWIKNKDVRSMHACQDDIRFVINLFKPKYYFPVRGHYTEIMQNAMHTVAMGVGLNYNNIFVLDNGMQLVFEAGKRPVVLPNEVTGIEVSPILLDGKGYAKMTDDIVKVRQRMSVDGAVIIAATVSLTEKKIIAGPDCQMRGFVFVKEAEPILKYITQLFIEEINAALNNGITDFASTKEIISDRIKKFIKRENGREPYIDPIIIVK